MRAALISFYKNLMEIRKEERLKTFLMFFYFFSIITLNWMLKPVQKSLFMAEFGADKIRYVNVGEGFFLFVIASCYIGFAKRVSARKFYYGISVFFAIGYAFFWYLAKVKMPWISVLFWLWQASSTITLTTAFWTLANDLFNVDEAKRIFGVMISGGSLGGILGSYLAKQLVKTFQTEDLILIAGGITAVSICALHLLLRQIRGGKLSDPAAVESEDISHHKHEPGSKLSTYKIFFKSRYLLMIAGIVILPKMVSTIIDNQFSVVVEQSIQGKEEVTAYFGVFGMWLNAITFISQAFGTSFFMQSLGVGFSIWILPIGLGILSGGTLFFPTLAMSTVMRLFDLSANYSIQQASKEVFYLPIASEIRRRVKPIIDMLGFRFAKTLAGLYIALFAFLFHVPDKNLNILVLTLIPFWIFLVWHMRKSYVALLRKHLIKEKKFEEPTRFTSVGDMLSFLYDEKNFQEIRSLMTHRSASVRKIAATYLVAHDKSQGDRHAARKLIDQIIWEDDNIEKQNPYGLNFDDQSFLRKLIAPIYSNPSLDLEELKERLKRDPDKILMKLTELFRKPLNGIAEKKRASRILEFIPKQESVDLLLQNIAATQDHSLRRVYLGSLNRIHDKNTHFKINRFLVRGEISREVRVYCDIRKVAVFYGQKKIENREDNLWTQVIINALSDESIGRLFDCLDLLYPAEKIKSIQDKITDNEPEITTRAHAIELLHNILDPGIWMLIQPIFFTPLAAQVQTLEIKKVIRDYSQSTDPWFSWLAREMGHELGLNGKEDGEFII